MDKAQKANGETFRREHLAEFTDSNSSWITCELLEPCILRGCPELPRVFNGTYVAAVDPAFLKCDFGFAVLHRSDGGDVSVICVQRWTGSKSVPLDFEAVCRQVQAKLKQYEINELVGDQYCFAILNQHFAKLGIFYREVSFSGRTRASIVGNLRQLMVQRKIVIVGDRELLRQFRSLEEFRCSNGNVDIRPPRSSKDDMAVAVALAAQELSAILSERYDPVVRGTVEVIVTTGRGAGLYPIGPDTCRKFPGCWDRGRSCECYG